jgi:hypothetical protein
LVIQRSTNLKESSIMATQAPKIGDSIWFYSSVYPGVPMPGIVTGVEPKKDPKDEKEPVVISASVFPRNGLLQNKELVRLVDAAEEQPVSGEYASLPGVKFKEPAAPPAPPAAQPRPATPPAAQPQPAAGQPPAAPAGHPGAVAQPQAQAQPQPHRVG